MTRSVVAAAAFLGVSGCSGEDLAERVAEEAIEQGLEAEGQSGDVDIDLDGDGVRIETPDGSAVFDVDGDGEGNISIQGDDGDVEVDLGGADGQTVISTPDGEMVIGAGELPDGFPESVPLPRDLAIESVVSMDGDQGTAFTVTGQVQDDVATSTGEYIAALETAGYAQQSITQTPDGSFFDYAGPEWRIGGGFYNNGADGGGSIVNLSVHREP